MDKQKIVTKYTKLISQILYNEIVEVKFVYYLTPATEEESPILYGLLDDKRIIYFNGAIYGKEDLEDDCWDTIVHEVTHLKIPAHTKVFAEEFEFNLKKLEHLRREFNKEVGWEKDFVWEYDPYYDEDMNNEDKLSKFYKMPGYLN